MWAVAKTLRSHPLSVGQARNFCARRLESVLSERTDTADVVADTATVASELVTNAVTAGSSRIELRLRLSDSSVLVEVADDAQGSVAIAEPSTTDTAGRGLIIVSALSRSWGVATDNGTKSVWAEIDLAADS